jgi:hypothetical protein
MMRMKLIAAIAAVGTFALVACSSNTGGTASAATSAATSAVSSAASSAPAPGSSSAADGASSSADTGAATTAAGDTGSSADATTTTIGNGSLDAQSAAWFDAFCTGLTPLSDAGNVLSGADATDPAAQLTASVAAFNAIGDAFTNTANALKSLPAPTFAHGDEIASKIVTGLAQAGPQVKAAAQTLSQVKATDEAGVQAAIATAAGTMSSAAASLDPGNYELDAGTQADIEKIPSCAKVGFGGSDSGGASATS